VLKLQEASTLEFQISFIGLYWSKSFGQGDKRVKQRSPDVRVNANNIDAKLGVVPCRH